ncbi:MAG TPA: TIGR04282 family arsenosugar biosynthesis glycosyltransferase [Chryseolinea sp.]|nr:TIGR04282 family arsenosugar biosynthesis glycosyltransferase [Chryseolinea sp.]
MKRRFDAPSKQLLIIFYRNPQLGKVKTRLAAELGDSQALAIYLYLASYTRTITETITVDKVVFYSDYIDNEDNWSNSGYLKHIQEGSDLGDKMRNAFKYGFDKGYNSICIIGTDCFELSSSIISNAFEALTVSDAVIGPAKDGGYYLLGMNSLHEQLFRNKSWSTNSVFKDTLGDFKAAAIKFYELPELSDIDKASDLPRELRHLSQ